MRAYSLPHVQASWIRETQLLEKLHHVRTTWSCGIRSNLTKTNVVSLLGFDGRQFAIYLEHLPRSLNRGTQCNFSCTDNHIILRDSSCGLVYLASLGVCHNDIKPGNIAYSRERGAVLLDFGMATEGNQRQRGGTPWYLPREYYDTGFTSPAGDVWALGVTLLYTLGVIPLPDRPENVPENHWQIGNARRRTEPDYGKMDCWFERINHIRETKLDRRDLLQSLVHDMLESDSKRRITAADIHSQLSKVAS